MKFTIALAQIDPVLGDIGQNVQKHLEMAEKAIQAGAQVVVFPELSLTGYSIRDMNWDLALNPLKKTPLLAPLLEKSRSISILAGAVEEDATFRLYNSALFFEEGTVRSVHRKVYPPTYGMFEEMRYFNRGMTVAPFQSRHGLLGALICEDMWHIPLPYVLAQSGAQIIIALVASPTRLGGNEEQLQTDVVNSENHRAYARLLTTYIAFCNRVGYEDGVNFWGGSSVVGPDGETVAKGKLFDTDLVVAHIDDDEVRRARRFSRHFLDDDVALTIGELSRVRRKSE